MKKKSFAVAFVYMVCMILSVFAGTLASAEEKPEVRVGALKGPTSIGMVKMMSDAENGLTEYAYDYTMAAAADELTPLLLRGEMDIAAVPINLASVLYAKSDGAVRLIAVNTLGVVDIIEKGGTSVQKLADLKGKTVYATGKGTTPEYALTYLLRANGLDIDSDVTVEWKSEPTEVVALMATEDQAVAMLPQPFVTVALGTLENARLALDLTKEWDSLDNGSRFVTAGIIARAAFIEEHPEAVSAFLKTLSDSTEYVNTNIREGAALVEKYGIVKAAVAEKAIPFCNVVCLTGSEMVSAASGFLKILYEMNPASVGGMIPEDGFFKADA